ncbi:hypothetical protein EUGRSUZ_H02639 [Eucalyptus grandis]|uniref:Uncharacterized protein n=2 Tax=Eucalyptus grandis TaxID=71139 RepID=A0ACC3JS34_EUCGR|nr:hypothetical protein EUGRSUZ_H02639 [Eucalyptus grandis]
MQGPINPGLQFAKRLLHGGAEVTFATSDSACRRKSKDQTYPEGLHFVAISDGYDNGFKLDDNMAHSMSDLKHRGSKMLKDLVISIVGEGRPYTCLVYSLHLPWATGVAREFHVPSALLCIQPATLDSLNQENNPRILVNTFDSLEPEALRAIDSYNVVGIGPLIPLGIDPLNTSFGGDLFFKSKEYTDWLDSKAPASVVYVSFGSLGQISKRQAEELTYALLDCGEPIFWVIRAKQNGEEEKDEDRLSCMQELEEKGMIVPWCSQLEVLSHPSLGCFLTHCGWNSTLESLAPGVPMVALPQWIDLIEGVWRTGVRMRPNEEGLMEAGEIRRCLETVMADGERREEMRRNAAKWKKLAVSPAA